nr:ORF1a putative 25K replicase component [carrot red leaf virus associated RNA 2]
MQAALSSSLRIIENKAQPVRQGIACVLDKIVLEGRIAARVGKSWLCIVGLAVGIFTYRKYLVNKQAALGKNTLPRASDCIEDTLEVEEDSARELVSQEGARQFRVKAALFPSKENENLGKAASILAEPTNKPLAKRKTRLRPNCTGKFIRVVRAEIKAQMGTPTPSAANEAVIRHMMAKYCSSHNIRTTSYAHLVSRVVREVMTPYPGDQAEVERANSIVNRIHNWLVQYRK